MWWKNCEEEQVWDGKSTVPLQSSEFEKAIRCLSGNIKEAGGCANLEKYSEL